MKTIRIFWLLLLPLVLAAPCRAAFQMRHTSARSAAMGNAFLAGAGEAASLFSNPAGLAGMPKAEASFLYAKPFAGLPNVNLNAGHAALALPTRAGHVGLGYSLFSAGGLLQEQTLALGYAATFRSLQVGLAAKQLSHAYDIHDDAMAHSDPVFADGTSASALAFDAGMIAPLGKALKLGLAVRNINQPNVGLATKDRVAREIQTGLMLNMAGLGVKATGDILMQKAAAGEVKNAPVPMLGLEKTFKNALALRLGANTNEFTAGFGARLKSVAFDYALVLNKNLMEDNAGSHKMGLKYRFASAPLALQGSSAMRSTTNAGGR